MSAHGFRSVFMVGGIAAAALGCYLVSLRVASERAELEAVENKIVLAQRDIRLLNTEIGTRGRLAQLERWNVKVIRLSAPSADQFVSSGFQLATLAKPEAKPAIEAPVVYASAPAPARREPVVTNDDGSAPAPVRTARPVSEMMHVAGYVRPSTSRPVDSAKPATKPAARDAGDRKVVTAAIPKADAKPAKSATTTAVKPAKPAATPAAKPAKSATIDPLGPLSNAPRKAKSAAADGKPAAKASSTPTKSKTTKESGSRQ